MLQVRCGGTRIVELGLEPPHGVEREIALPRGHTAESVHGFGAASVFVLERKPSGDRVVNEYRRGAEASPVPFPDTSSPTCIAVCAESKRLVTAVDNAVSVWDAHRRVLLATLTTALRVRSVDALGELIVYGSTDEARLIHLRLDAAGSDHQHEQQHQPARKPLCMEFEFDDHGLASREAYATSVVTVPSIQAFIQQDARLNNNERAKLVSMRQRQKDQPFAACAPRKDFSHAVHVNEALGVRFVGCTVLLHRRLLASDRIRVLSLLPPPSEPAYTSTPPRPPTPETHQPVTVSDGERPGQDGSGNDVDDARRRLLLCTSFQGLLYDVSVRQGAQLLCTYTFDETRLLNARVAGSFLYAVTEVGLRVYAIGTSPLMVWSRPGQLQDVVPIGRDVLLSFQPPQPHVPDRDVEFRLPALLEAKPPSSTAQSSSSTSSESVEIVRRRSVECVMLSLLLDDDGEHKLEPEDAWAIHSVLEAARGRGVSDASVATSFAVQARLLCAAGDLPAAAPLFARSNADPKRVFAFLGERDPKALTTYLRAVLDRPSTRVTDLFSRDADFTNATIEHFAKHAPSKFLATLMQTCLFWSPMDPAKVLSLFPSSSAAPGGKMSKPKSLEVLARSLLLLQMDRVEEAGELLLQLRTEKLAHFLSSNAKLMTEWVARDALCTFLMANVPDVTLEVLASPVWSGVVTVEQARGVIQDAKLWQTFLCAVVDKWGFGDHAITGALLEALLVDGVLLEAQAATSLELTKWMLRMAPQSRDELCDSVHALLLRDEALAPRVEEWLEDESGCEACDSRAMLELSLAPLNGKLADALKRLCVESPASLLPYLMEKCGDDTDLWKVALSVLSASEECADEFKDVLRALPLETLVAAIPEDGDLDFYVPFMKRRHRERRRT